MAYVMPVNVKAEFFREFMNDFLTVEGFALHYSLTVKQAKRIIRHGKMIHNDNCKTW